MQSFMRAQPSSHPAAVFLLDDHELVRRGLREMIGRESDFVICGEAGDAGTALGAIRAMKPDLVLTDIALPEGDGLELIKQVRAWHPLMRILVVSMYDERL